jgi:AcrR family transcriptional regulator
MTRHTTVTPSGQPRTPKARGVPPPSDNIRAVARALHILEVVGQAPTGLPVKDIAQRCGITVASAYHHARTLTFQGYLLRWDATTYTLGFATLGRARDLYTQLTHLIHDRASATKLAKLLKCPPSQVAGLLAQAAALSDPAGDRPGPPAGDRPRPSPSTSGPHRASGRPTPSRAVPPR